MKNCLLIFLFLLTKVLSAQEAQTSVDSVLDLSLEQLLNVRIVSASKFEQTIKEAPSTISVVTREQIKNYGWISLNDVLSKQPGFAITQDYERQTISSRGTFESWNSDHLLMLVDGVPLNISFGGSALTGETTSLSFVKSAEIIRGPGSALYGSNATNGVIGLRSLSADDLEENVSVRYRRGSWNTNIYDMTLNAKSQLFSFVSSFNYYGTDGFSYKSLDASNTKLFNIDNSKASSYLFNKIEGRGRFAGWSLQHHEQGIFFSTGHGWLNYVPDTPEDMNEHRRTLILSYRTPNKDKKLQHEYVVKYGSHQQDFNQRFYPTGVYYSQGLTEILKTKFYDLFGRTQWTYRVGEKSNLLGGIEYNYFGYVGDKIHLSNVNLNTDYSETANNQLVPVGKFLPWYNKGYNSSGIYTQYYAHIAKGLTATIGLRYDLAFFSYKDIYNGDQVNSKKLGKLNPRIAIVYSPTTKLTFKAMAGNAFRTPSPFELFVGNSYNGATNPKDLKPEAVTTYEFSSDYSLSDNISWRVNGYQTKISNVIAYGGAANILINLLSATTRGLETEWKFATKKLDAFVNYSYAQRVGESASYPTVSIHKKTLTWYPTHLANVGLSYKMNKINFSVQSHYQGKVLRKDSDRSPEYDNLRGTNVKAWITADARINFQLSSNVSIGLQGNNLTGSKGGLFKSYLNPFDYQIPGRRLMIDLQFKL